jgi:hypothetical protein
MTDLLPLLAVVTGLLLLVCWPWGVVHVWRATAHRGRLAKVLWRFAAAAPGAGFLLFAASRWRKRAADGLGRPWRPLGAHIALVAVAVPGLALSSRATMLSVGPRHRADYRQEWWHARTADGRPGVCLAMSGGGIRSAAFNVGVLHGLREQGLLEKVDVVSSVSGGSYAMSWFLLQQYYAEQEARGARPSGAATGAALDAMFDPEGVAQRHLASTARQFAASDDASYFTGAGLSALASAVLLNVSRLTSWVTPNENLGNAASATRRDYRASLQRTWQEYRDPGSGKLLNRTPGGMGARVREAAAHLDLSDVRKVSFAELARFAGDSGLPFFVFNTTVRLDATGRPPLWAQVFELNAWGMGSDSYGYRAWTDLDPEEPRLEAARLVNVAPAISGAAVSVVALKKGSVGRAAVAAANIDLGYLVPRFLPGDRGSLFLTDGGHSENLGVYALARRGCRHLIVVDAEEEPSPYRFEGYTRVRDALRDELGMALSVPIDSFSHARPVMCGDLGPLKSVQPEACRVAYVKLAMDKTRPGDYPPSLSDPALGEAFPMHPTLDQNFGPDHYLAYRDLGRFVTTRPGALDAFRRVIAAGH